MTCQYKQLARVAFCSTVAFASFIIGSSAVFGQLTYTTGLDVWLDAADIDGSANATLSDGDLIPTWTNKGTTGVNDAIFVTGTSSPNPGSYFAGGGPAGEDVVAINNTRYQFGQEFMDSSSMTMYFRVFRDSSLNGASVSSLYTDYGTVNNELLTVRAGDSVTGARDFSGDNTWVDDNSIKANDTWETLFFEFNATTQTTTFGELGGTLTSSIPNANYDPATTFEGTFNGPVTLFTFWNGDNSHDFNGMVSEVLIYDHLLDATAQGQVESYLATKVGPGRFSPEATIDRNTGAITLSNSGTLAGSIVGYSFTSAAGALNQSAWNSIATTGDSNSGTMSIDPDDEWTVLTGAGDRTDLSETLLGGTGPGDGFSLVNGSPLNLGNAWLRNPTTEDVMLELLLASGATLSVPVDFVGNGGLPLMVGDLDFQNGVTLADWVIYRNNFRGNLPAGSPFESYALGDMDGDGDNDWDDFALFQAAYDAVNGSGSLALAASGVVPEPSSLLLLALIVPAALVCCRTHKSRTARSASLPECPPIETQVNAMKQVNFRSSALAFVAFAAAFSVTNIASAATFDATIGSTAVTIVETDPFTSGTPGNTVRVIDSGMPWSNIGGTGVDMLWTDRTYSPFNTGYASLLGETDRTIEVNGNDNTGAPALRTTVTGLTPGIYQVFQLYTTRSDTNTDDGRIRSVLNGDVLTEGTNFNWENRFDNLPAVMGSAWTTSIANLGLTEPDTTSFYVEAAGARNALGVALAGRNHHIGVAYRRLPQLTLEVNTVTGNLTLANNSGSDIDITGYELSSVAGSLTPANWTSLQDSNVGGGTVGDGTGFEELGTGSANFLDEAILLGDYTFANNAAFSLGNVYNLGVQDLALRVRNPEGEFIPAIITEVTGAPGDYNSDGFVDAADYTVWRDNLGSSIPLTNQSPAAATPNLVDAEDYTFWRSRFGNSSGAESGSLQVASVPEPSSMLLVFATTAGLLLVCGARRQQRQHISLWSRASNVRRLLIASVLLAIAWAAVGSSALAVVTNDREYLFGEDPFETASQGAFIGSISLGGRTLDSMGDPPQNDASFIDLTPVNNPTYQDVGPLTGGLARPYVTGLEYGARFNGASNQLLFSNFPLSRPDTLNARLGSNYPIDYSGILGHGLQLWVYPDAAALGSTGSPTTYQSIVADNIRSGGPAISATGRWTQTNSTIADGANALPATVDVGMGDTWYHVMHHHQPISGNTFASILYVDGVAVSANISSILTTGVANYTGQLVVGAREVANNGMTAAYGNYFTGVIDDLEMYVFGNNETGTPGDFTDGENWGTFNLFTDNEWIREEILNIPNGGILRPGDVNQDGFVNNSDATAFIAGWLSTNSFTTTSGTLLVGDWNSWANGDLNLDGRTSLADAFILDRALRGNGSGGLNFSLLGAPAVPEPSTIALLMLGLVAVVFKRVW